VLAALDAVTLEDIQRVAQDIIREEGLNFAAIGSVRRPRPLREPLAPPAP
jgi:hypothetical protein